MCAANVIAISSETAKKADIFVFRNTPTRNWELSIFLIVQLAS